MKKLLHYYLHKYYDLQQEILLCYRPTETSTWSDRCLYLSREYNAEKKYNHRSILKNEVVIEFDDKDTQKNLDNAREAAKRLRADGFVTAMFSSGNKSTHVHTFIDVAQASNIRLLKSVLIRHYTKGLPTPDLQLCADNHLIRAEYGIHEKTGKEKSPVYIDGGYPVIKKIPSVVWECYGKEMSSIVQQRMTKDLHSVEGTKGFQFILSTDEFRKSDDARERALFMLIHTLKPKYAQNKLGLVLFLQQWYRYSGGIKLSPKDIESKVNYHWNRHYIISARYLNELLQSIGREDLIQ